MAGLGEGASLVLPDFNIDFGVASAARFFEVFETDTSYGADLSADFQGDVAVDLVSRLPAGFEVESSSALASSSVDVRGVVPVNVADRSSTTMETVSSEAVAAFSDDFQGDALDDTPCSSADFAFDLWLVMAGSPSDVLPADLAFDCSLVFAIDLSFDFPDDVSQELAITASVAGDE